MKLVLKTLVILGLMGWLVAPVSGEILPREYFTGIAPETFDTHGGWNMENRDFDFGLFSIAGWFDTYAFYMPTALPVEIPAIGGDNLTLTLHPPVPSLGFDFGSASFGDNTITFFGVDGTGASIELASFLVSELMASGSGPSGYQGFVGFRDDLGRDIYQVTVGPIDLYLDNVYLGVGAVGVESTTLGGVKALYR